MDYWARSILEERANRHESALNYCDIDEEAVLLSAQRSSSSVAAVNFGHVESTNRGLFPSLNSVLNRLKGKLDDFANHLIF